MWGDDLDPRTPRMDVFDVFSYLLIAPMSALASLLLIIAHVFYKELRKQPGDLITMIALSEFCLSVHWFISALRSDFVTEQFDKYGEFCEINSYFAVFAGTSDLMYNFCFLAHVIISLRNSIKKIFVPKLSYHLFSLSVAAIVMLASKKGMNVYGTCSSEVRPETFIAMSFLFITGILAANFVLSFTKRTLNVFSIKQAKLRRDFFNYYKSYIKAFRFMTTIIFMSYMTQLYTYETRPVPTPIDGDPDILNERINFRMIVFNLGRMGNTIKVLMPLLMFFIRIQDPLVFHYVFKPFQHVQDGFERIARVANRLSKGRTNTGFKFNTEEEPSGGLTLPPIPNNDKDEGVPDVKLDIDSAPNNNSSPVSSSSERLAKQDALQDLLLTEDTHTDLNWINMLSSKAKDSYYSTVMSCIARYFPSVLQERSRDPSASQSSLSTKMNSDIAMEVVSMIVVGTELREAIDYDGDLANCQLTIFAPKLFSEIHKLFEDRIKFEVSMEVKANIAEIKKAGKGDGGASGELFIKTFDNRLIMKTMTEQELQLFLKLSVDYLKHLQANRGSLISKIVGIFKIRFTDANRDIYVMLMENVFYKLPSPILRVYDIKGSTFKRQVLQNGDYESIGEKSTQRQVMKDLDFIKIEKNIELIDEITRNRFLSRVYSDADFFKCKGIIDYSLLIGVMDRDAANLDLVEEHQNNANSRMVLGKTKRLIYFVGIIDYLQLYTFNKAAERAWKRFSKCSPNLETSSQPPDIYAKRYTNFIGFHFSN